MTESLQVAYWLCVGSLFFAIGCLGLRKEQFMKNACRIFYRPPISSHEFFKGAIRLHLWLLPCSQSQGKGGDRQ